MTGSNNKGLKTLTKLNSLNPDIKEKKISGYPMFNKKSPNGTSFTERGFSSSEGTKATSNPSTYYITYASSYSFNPSTGKYSLNNAQTCVWNNCYQTLASGTYYTGYVTLRSSSAVYANTNRDTIYRISANSTSASLKYYSSLIPTLNAWDENDVGVFSMEDDYGTSYFFRGNVTNNYFRFGKNSSNANMWWRIMRINGDGSIRLMYDGTSAYANGTSNSNRRVTTSAFNSVNTDAGYLGYMYGTFTVPSTSYETVIENNVASTIKGNLESWYTTNIQNTGYSTYLSDEIFCNDRTIKSGNTGYGANSTDYGAYVRNVTNKTPSLKCPKKNDAFTLNLTSTGNGKLSKPVGLLTADDLAVGGNLYNSTNYYSYFYKGSTYITMSPYYMRSAGAQITVLYSTGYIYGVVVSTANGLVPVINISPNYVTNIKGLGTTSSPFYLDV